MVVPTCKSECCVTNTHTHTQTTTRVQVVTNNIWFIVHSCSPFGNHPWRTHIFCWFTSSHYFSVVCFLVYQSCAKYSVMNAEIRQINYERLTLLNSTTFHRVFITVTRKSRYWKETQKVSVRTAHLPTGIRTRSLLRVKYKCSSLHHDADWRCIVNCQKTKRDRECT
jgi:hypothetical protein